MPMPTKSEHTELSPGATHGRKPNIGRNEPCPCGSGKKHKKCCLAKDEAAARAKAVADVRAAEAARQAEQAAHRAQREQSAREWEARRQAAPAPDDDAATEFKKAREPDWPPLSAEDQRPVDEWWEEVAPVYLGKGSREKCGWLLERTLAFLDQQPRLFRYLDLHDEFLFELGGALARAGRMDDYLALLRRLRQEEPSTYFECFGYFDHDLIADALRTGRRQEIPAYLDLFRLHPVKHIDQLAEVVDLLAWRGCETELRGLLEATAQTIADSPDVLGGGFGLFWLTHLAMAPFLEAGDDSEQAIDQLCQATGAVGYLAKDAQNQEWLRRAVRLASRSHAEARLDLKKSKDRWLQNDAGWSFTGWARQSKGLSWTSARFLANALLDYWGWKDAEEKKGASPFGLNVTRLDRYLAQRCRDIFCLKGVRALSTLQAFHYFTEYLVVHDYFSVAEAGRLQSAAAGFFETIRGAVDSSDPAYRLCPTYAALLAGPGAASSPPAVALAPTPKAD